MPLQGKGFFISDLSQCGQAEPASILAAAKSAGLSHIIVKIAEGVTPSTEAVSGIDLIGLVVQAMHAAKIDVWGWHPIHGMDPSGEASLAISRVQSLGLDGYVVVPGTNFLRSGMHIPASEFMKSVRKALKVPIALNSHWFPNYHTDFPWSTFLEYCDYHMPLVSWVQAHNAGEQLCESWRQCTSLPNARPFVPTAGIGDSTGWTPTPEEINEFLETARVLAFPAINFFDWDACQGKQSDIWSAISSFGWSSPSQGLTSTKPESLSVQGLQSNSSFNTLLEALISALNDHQAEKVSALFDPQAIQVWNERSLRSIPEIQANYYAFLSKLPAGVVFSVSKIQIKKELFHFSWIAGSLRGESTQVIKKGKILLDYTQIS